MSVQIRGRLAPSPTGYLHLGNAWAFLLAWLSARATGGTIVLRMEDIDPERSQPEYHTAILEDLSWLGLDWDYGPNADPKLGPYSQSERGDIYAAILELLDKAGLTYPCFCSRKELRMLATAPHIGDTGAPYPGTCRNLTQEQCEERLACGRHACVRLRCSQEPITFIDAIQGAQHFLLSQCGGDFALRRSDGVVAYQLAVTADDALMGITQVVRGRDILPSTPRQIALLQILGYTPPQYAHLPLLLDAQGDRMAKRHKSIALRALRRMGAEPQRVIGLLGHKAGILAQRQPALPQDLLPAFDVANLPTKDICITNEDLAFLVSARK